MLRQIKRDIERVFPDLASSIRESRQNRTLRRAKFGRTPHGFLFIGNAQMQRGEFEPAETTFIANAMKNIDVFIDIGANVGYYTCLARSLGKKVIAFEPVSQNLEYLYANLIANGWRDVEIFPIGLCDGPGVATLWGGGTGGSLIEGWADISPTWTRPVPLSTLDKVIGDRFCDSRILVKIDVEGSEYTVLKGGAGLLNRRPNVLWLVEVCFRENHPVGINPHFGDVFQLFWEAGYDASGATTGEIVTPMDVESWLSSGTRTLNEVNFVFS
jgi:FkbM family methyltransferase